MLRARFPALLTTLVLFFGLATAGCDTRGVRVQLRAFEASQLRGLWIWRASPESGEYQRFTQIEFGALEERDGQEYLAYIADFGGDRLDLQTAVERAGGEASADLNVVLAFLSSPGTYKISSYNAAGESPLSEGTLVY